MKSETTRGLFSPSNAVGEPFAGKNPIAVMMSGGVDSSTTAWLLQEAGWDVVGITMKIPVLGGDPLRPCCGVDAALVSGHLRIPHYFLDVEAHFTASVIEPFSRAYGSGETPSPCIDCNARVKFGFAWQAIRDELHIEHLATGHYVRIFADADGVFRMGRAVDLSRDQSYFLYGVPRDRLPFLHCPLGGHTKDGVREMAARAGLPLARKPDSMELCFAGEGSYREVLADMPANPGPILDTTGAVIGEHQGIQHYTVGQRRGLPASTKGPLYVLKIDSKTNSITAGAREEAYISVVGAGQINILYPEQFDQGRRAYGKIRSIGEPFPCTITAASLDAFTVRFDEPVFAPAPGQHLVIYDAAGCVIAGGTIR